MPLWTPLRLCFRHQIIDIEIHARLLRPFHKSNAGFPAPFLPSPLHTNTLVRLVHCFVSTQVLFNLLGLTLRSVDGRFRFHVSHGSVLHRRLASYPGTVTVRTPELTPLRQVCTVVRTQGKPSLKKKRGTGPRSRAP